MTTEKNRLYFGDNLEVLREYVPSESVDLVYLDPPFNSNRNYSVIFSKNDAVDDAAAAQIEAFEDTWRWTHVTEQQYMDFVTTASSNAAQALTSFHTLLGKNDAMAYLVNMAPRLVELHRVLKSTGSLFLHCDPTMSHYLKILLDAIFGPKNFRNEIVWKRSATKGDARRKLGRNHDIVLYYTKSPSAHFAMQFTEHSDSYKTTFKYDDGDGRGPYASAPLDSPSPRPNLTFEYKGYQPPSNGWRVDPDEMARLDADGRLIFPKSQAGRIRRKLFQNEQPGVPIDDVWTDLPPISSQDAERLGYPTQKPLRLLERIITMASKPGDVVLDPFCGCGTTVDAAQKLGRRWVGIDITYIAIDLIVKRLQHTYGDDIRDTFSVSGIPYDLAAAQAMFDKNAFEFERWAVSLIGAQPNEKQVGDKGIDGVGRFALDGKGGIGRILVSVKGGKTINPAMARDLDGTVTQHGAEMGILITLVPATRGVQEVIDHGGTWTLPANGQVFPRLQHITVRELLQGKEPLRPPMHRPYIEAKRQRKKSGQMDLF
ncbi:restriction endonuclease subunit M [Micrococcus antarcticus]|uniref:site-specific DNA-methyltransferase n=1 Tax=Micrococcus antarcticus TaxID=86171 RepID=UPI00384D3B17